MTAPFDLFWVDSEGAPVWVTAAATLESARAHAYALGKSRPGKYLIVSLKTGNKLEIEVARSRSLSAQDVLPAPHGGSAGDCDTTD